MLRLRSSICYRCTTLAPSFFASAAVSDPRPDRHDLITKFVRELNPEVTKTADTFHRNQVSGERTAMPQRVVGGNSGTEQRRCFGIA